MKIRLEPGLTPEQVGEQIVDQMKAQGIVLSSEAEAYLKTPMDLSKAKVFKSPGFDEALKAALTSYVASS
jgi:hypothetical protein